MHCLHGLFSVALSIWFHAEKQPPPRVAHSAAPSRSSSVTAMKQCNILPAAMADGNPCATIGHGHEQLPRGLLLCSEVVGTVHWDERDSQQPRKWPFPIHAVALTMRFSLSEDTMTVTFLTLLEVLATYMILRLCEQLLKALIRGRKKKTYGNSTNDTEIDKEWNRRKLHPPEVVWVSNHGQCYHVDASCRGLRTAISVTHKRQCLVCTKKNKSNRIESHQLRAVQPMTVNWHKNKPSAGRKVLQKCQRLWKLSTK